MVFHICVDYQSVLTGIFYYFKGSAVRTHKLSDIQTLLDEPTLKVKEVHQVSFHSSSNHLQNVGLSYNILHTGQRC